MTGPFDAALPVPEHAIEPPVARGMAGQTSAGTLAHTPPDGPLLPATAVPRDTPLSARHAITACCAESHCANATAPEFKQVGRTESRQRRNSVANDTQAGTIEGNDAQLVAQSPVFPEEGHAAAILSHVAEQAAANWL